MVNGVKRVDDVYYMFMRNDTQTKHDATDIPHFHSDLNSYAG